jgi:hypothetical protein
MILAPFLLALAPQPFQTPIIPTRPRDPFVFRCVLDKRARMITVALSDDLWVAWDATNCGLYKAWKGGVNFDGPVYTTVHGPQPTSKGNAYTLGIDGPVWTAEVNDKPVECKVQYEGYRLLNNTVTLTWRIELKDGRKIEVDELPEYAHPNQFMGPEQLEDAVLGDGKQPGLQRIFSARDIPSDVKVSVTIRTDGAVGKLANLLERERFDDIKDAKGATVETHVFSQLPLTAAAPKNAILLFFKPIELPADKPADKPAKKAGGQ